MICDILQAYYGCVIVRHSIFSGLVICWSSRLGEPEGIGKKWWWQDGKSNLTFSGDHTDIPNGISEKSPLLMNGPDWESFGHVSLHLLDTFGSWVIKHG